MSKNVSILEGSKAKSVNTVSRLVTDLQGGGLATWVPEDERIIKQKFISKNGSYLAETDSVYGFSKITVNVAGGAAGYTAPTITDDEYGPLTPDPSATPELIPPIAGGVGSSIVGIDPTTGNKYIATVGPNGTIEKKKIPSAIRVLMPPAKTTYTEGERINYAGLMIELLDGEGNHFENSDYPDGTLLWGAPYFIDGDTSKSYGVVTTIDTAQMPPASIATDEEAWELLNDVYEPYYYDLDYLFPNNRIFFNQSNHIDSGAGWSATDHAHLDATDNTSPVYAFLIGTYYTNEGYKNSAPFMVLCSENTFNYRGTEGRNVSGGVVSGTASKFTFNEKSLYYTYHSTNWTQWHGTPSVPINELSDDIDPNYAGPPNWSNARIAPRVLPRLAWYVLYSYSIDEVEIPVEWQSPYDQIYYGDTFKIVVNEKTESSDDGFEGSGGGKF